MQIGLNLANNSTVRTKHAAIITNGNRIISQGINLLRTHPIFRRYKPHVETIHAEAKALINAKNGIDGATLYSVRNYNGEFANSKPCDHCLAFIIESAIKTIVFYENGAVVKIRL